MRARSIVLVVLCVMIGGVAAAIFAARVLQAQGTYLPPEKLRFRLVGDEPVASPDGLSTVAGIKVLVLKDMRSGQCHIAFLSGTAISVTDAGVCLCLPKSPFLLRQLMLRSTMDTLLVDVGAPVRPPDPANMGAFSRGAPARNPRVTAPTPGVATHPTGTAAALQNRPLPLGDDLPHLDWMANVAGDREA
jgi:hypothetical protein